MSWVQVPTPFFPVQMAVGEENIFKRPNSQVDVLGQAIRKEKLAFLHIRNGWEMALPLLTWGCLQFLAPGCLRLWPVSICFLLAWNSCTAPCETSPKGWRAGTHLAHFPAGLPGWWRHVAKVHHFTWTFCLPGFTLNDTMAFRMGLSTLPQGQPALPRRVSGKSCSWSKSRAPRAMRPSTPGCWERKSVTRDCPATSRGVSINQPRVLKADGGNPHCAHHYFGWQNRKL